MLYVNNKHTFLLIAKDIQRCTNGDGKCLVAESNRVLHTYSNGHPGLNLIKVDPLHISEITLKQGSESNKLYSVWYDALFKPINTLKVLSILNWISKKLI